MFNMQNYGQRLKIALKARGKTRKELASELGISVQAVGDAIRGKTTAFTSSNNAKTARFLRVSSDWLASDLGPMDLIRQQPAAFSLMATDLAVEFDAMQGTETEKKTLHSYCLMVFSRNPVLLRAAGLDHLLPESVVLPTKTPILAK